MVTVSIVAGDSSFDLKQSLTDSPPQHYSVEIQSFSDLQKMVNNSSSRSYESRTFEVGGYKWKLCIYPNGNEKRNGKGYISMYLAIVETDALPLGWEVYVDFKVFMYDYLQDKFLKVQDGRERVWHLGKERKECGFPQLISKTDFQDTDGGFLRGDKCVFGVEIAVCSFGRGEVVPPIRNVASSSYIWKIDNFSKCWNDLEGYKDSGGFTLEGYKWELEMYTERNEAANGKSLSLVLTLDGEEFEGRVYVDFKLSILNQKGYNKRHCSTEAHQWFSIDSDTWSWELSNMLVEEINDESRGFLVDDKMHIEVRITGISTLTINTEHI